MVSKYWDVRNKTPIEDLYTYKGELIAFGLGWSHKAAEAGNADAMNAIGYMLTRTDMLINLERLYYSTYYVATSFPSMY